MGCTPAPRAGGSLNPTRSLSRGRPDAIGAQPEEWSGAGSVRPMPTLQGAEGAEGGEHLGAGKVPVPPPSPEGYGAQV